MEEQSLHQHCFLTGVYVSYNSKNTPGWRFEAGRPGLSAPVHPHVVDCWEDKGCEAIAESAHDCIDCVCNQTKSACLVNF